MKALELTLYPPSHSFPAGYDLPRNSRVTVRAATRMAQEKRFTEAELAAEEWHSVAREAESELRSRKAGDEIPAEYWRRINLESAPQTEVLHRFAILPHYDKEPNA